MYITFFVKDIRSQLRSSLPKESIMRNSRLIQILVIYQTLPSQKSYQVLVWCCLKAGVERMTLLGTNTTMGRNMVNMTLVQHTRPLWSMSLKKSNTMIYLPLNLLIWCRGLALPTVKKNMAGFAL